jgi:NADP-dependent 3-hydroxy acid dehydrogenase YdfG
VYVVFGASGGIGSALSKRLLAQPGATVVVAGRDEGRLQQLVSTMGGGIPLVGDPCDPKQVRAAAAAGTAAGKIRGNICVVFWQCCPA